MDHIDTDLANGNRKIYTKEVLLSLKNDKLSNLWPKSLDKSCVNNSGQWDPLRSFETAVRASETKRHTFYENKTFRNNGFVDKNKDDNISLRPERRKWNDGCQVSINKRNSDDTHTNSFRKSFPITHSGGGGDYERRNFTNRQPITARSSKKPPKLEKSSRNNSNLEEERKDNKEKPEWFSNGPKNCDETIELEGLKINNKSVKIDIKEDKKLIIDFKTDEKSIIEFKTDEKSIFTSPKREGSRFQEIFQKETENNHLKEESKEVENIIKTVLMDNVSKSDAEKLNKSLPNGVLTVEEIEKSMTPVDCKRAPSKSTTIDTLTSFEPSLNSLLSNEVPSPNVDNSKVVNWLSNLNINAKEMEMDNKNFYPAELLHFSPMNTVIPSQPLYTTLNYPKFPANIQHPPGLPLMVHNGHLHNQSFQQQQQQLSIQQTLLNQKQMAFMKQLNMGQSSNVNISQRNPLVNLQQEVYTPEKYKLTTQQSLLNDFQSDPNSLSNFFLKTNIQMNHHPHITDRNNMMAMNGPPGLTNMSSRPITKTNQQIVDFAQMNYNDLCHKYENSYHQRPIGNNHIVCNDINKSPMDIMLKNMRNRENILMNNSYANQQPFIMMSNNYENKPMQQSSSSNRMLANLFNVNSSYLPPLPQQAKYADQIETENN